MFSIDRRVRDSKVQRFQLQIDGSTILSNDVFNYKQVDQDLSGSAFSNANGCVHAFKKHASKEGVFSYKLWWDYTSKISSFTCKSVVL